MSHLSDAAGGHDGTCAFCGTSVKPEFVTCTGCGATWKSLVNSSGRLMVKGAWPAGLFCGFVSIGAFQSLAAATVVCLGVSLWTLTQGANKKTSAWYR